MSVTSGVGLIPQIEKFGREIAGNAYSSYYVIKRNDFAYNKSATKQFPEGFISMLTEYDEGALPNSIFTCFRIVDEECVPQFFDYLFHNNYHGSWLRKYIEVGARAHGSLSVDTRHLWDMPVALPRKEEQQKIADCLSSLDDLIAAEDKKLEALKSHKKGLMQKLFPAKGETVPEWRFPGFTDAWEQHELGDHCNMFNGDRGIHYPNAVDMVSEGIPFINAGDLQNGRVNLDTANKISRAKYNQLGGAKIRLGDIVYCLRGTLGKNAFIDNFDEGTVASSLVVIRPNGIDGRYLFQVLNSHIEYRQRTICDEGAAQPNLSARNLSGFKIPIPAEEEQKRISMFLSALDRLITLQQCKVETLKLHKKGLMQGLFPAIEEVSE